MEISLREISIALNNSIGDWRGGRKMGKRKRRGKLSWRSKRANKGRKPNLG